MHEILKECFEIDPKYPKNLLKRASLNINLRNFKKAKEDLLAVKKIDASLPQLRVEVSRLKAAIAASKNQSKDKFGGFLTAGKTKDMFASDESRFIGPRKKPDSLDLTNVDRKDWVKTVENYYGIDDMDYGDYEECLKNLPKPPGQE